MSIFTDRLNEMLKKRGITQRELAEKIGKTETSVSRYVNGDRIPKGPAIVKMAQVLNVQTDYLLGNDVWFDCGPAVGPDERGGCKYCNIERRDYTYSTIPVSMGDFGDYEIFISISSRPAILVEFGEKHHEPVISVSSDKIKYCPYCGRRFDHDDN